jgi:DNA-binding NarL/FixJ family response regulator
VKKSDLIVVVLLAEAQENHCVPELSLDLNAITVAGEAIGLAASKRLLKLTDPDVAIVVMNGSVARCLRLVRGLTRACDAPALVISSRDEHLYAGRSLSAGARGYLMADASPDTLVAAIRAVSRGEVYLSGKVKAEVLKGFLEAAWNAGDEA